MKTLTEECSNKKTSVDSLKQRLNVAMKEKSQYEQMYQKTKEELDKKVCFCTFRRRFEYREQFSFLMLSPLFSLNQHELHITIDSTISLRETPDFVFTLMIVLY